MFKMECVSNEGLKVITISGYDDINNYQMGLKKNCVTNDLIIWWDPYSTCSSIIIDKENFPLYEIFKNALDEITNGQIFKNISPEIGYSAEQFNNNLGLKYALKRLYDPDTKKITWLSDNDSDEYANKLVMGLDEEENIVFDFIEGYNSTPEIAIAFRGEGSRYHECFLPFVRMFDELIKYDENNHQITMDEHIKRLTKEKNISGI